MPTEITVRDLPPEVVELLSCKASSRRSREDFLREQLSMIAFGTGTTGDLFQSGHGSKLVMSGLPFKFIDLFAGIGGFRCGMTSLGGECVFTSEWDRFSAKTYEAWYRDSHIHTDDVRTLDPARDIPDHDVLCAGFPCQPFSLAGVSKKQSLGRSHGFQDEKQGNLFFSIMDIVDAKRPPVLFLENVKNLASHDQGNTWTVIRDEIERRGYQVLAQVVDARYWVPQHRERIFIVCFDKEVFTNNDTAAFSYPDFTDRATPKLSSVLGAKAPDRKYMLSDKLWAYLQAYAEKHRLKGNGFGYGLVDGESVARTLSARYHKDGSEILIRQAKWRNPRRLTPSEARRLMGFNQRYASLFGHENGFPQVVSDTQAYRQFGNAVVPLVVEEVGKGIIDVMTEKLTSGGRCLFKQPRARGSVKKRTKRGTPAVA